MSLMNYLLILLLAITSISAQAEYRRSYKAKSQFKQMHPCPATGRSKGSCPGYIIDHRIGLCVGGIDSPKNMRWMTVEQAKLKDKWECKPGWEEKLAECERQFCFVN